MNKVIDLKGSILSLTVLKIYSNDIDQIKQALEQKVAQAPEFFKGVPVVFEPQVDTLNPTLLAQIMDFLHQKGMVPIGIRTDDEAIKEQANYAGLAVFDPKQSSRQPSTQSKSQETEAPTNNTPNQAAPSDVADLHPASGLQTAMVVQTSVRSGQQIYAKNRDLIILGSINPGAEVISDGSVHVYGTVRGKVFAGSQGETQARIFAHKIDAELVCIAGFYQLAEDILPAHKQGFVEISLTGEKLNFKLLNALT
jgi:septum site-determining protein MinC